jgi:PAS domain S-box-containing protein
MRLAPSRGAPRPLAPYFPDAAQDARRYHALFDLAPDAYVVTDVAGTIAEANAAARTLLARPLPELSGRPLVELVATADRRAFLVRLEKARFARAAPAAEWRLRLRQPGGEPFDAAVAVTSAVEVARGRGPLLLWRLRRLGVRRRAEDARRPARHRSLQRRRRVQRQRVRVLAAQSVRAQEEEARRIAHRLHDEAGQMTATLHLSLQELEGELPARHRRRVHRVRALVLDLEERLRSLSHELRPTILDDLGLAPAIGFLAEAFSSRTGIRVEVRGDAADQRLDPPVETALYRMLQEALANVARHAQARRVVVDIRRRADTLRCSVQDDGAGFDPARAARAGGLGLLGMRERLGTVGGRLLVRSAPGRGTKLVAILSLRRRP